MHSASMPEPSLSLSFGLDGILKQDVSKVSANLHLYYQQQLCEHPVAFS